MDSKVLVIGLGGIGSEIVCKLEKETEYSKKNNVQFAAMDTDVNTLAALKRQGFGGKIITVSDRMTVGEYLEHNKESGRWYLKNEILSWKPVSEGAGQIRAVSRLALELAIKNGKLAPLYKVIRDLHMPSAKENEADNSAFRIIIVSTLAGGTGSGMLLPLAIHLRKYMIDFFKRKDVIIRGIFLMSDCLDMVVESIAERKSLRSNSYAAIKELDAFMKKADGYLDDRYHYVSLEAASDERDTPFLSYNYCYLFSARDKDKNEMYSFKELKEMVVQCVYAQILGPMQELNNSIEDNVLKSTMTAVQNLENAEFNRYCAAGIRVLRYPYYKILDYLAIEKLLNIFGEQWMEIDTAYDTEMARQEKREEEGYYAAEIRRDEFYVSYIDNSGGNSRLVQQIHQEMLTESERKRWEEYLENLDKNIYKLKENLKMTWRQEEALCRNTARTIREQPRERNRMSLNRLGEHWDRLVEKCERERGKISGGVGISFFGLCENGVIPKEHFYHWLINANGLFHMNSVRYFLYCTLYALKERRKRAEEENKELRKKLENVNKLKKKISSRGTIQLPWMYRKFANEICDAYDEYLNVLDEYYENWLKCRIYLVGIENLQKLVDTIEKFYEKFTDNIKIYQQKKENIQHLLTDIEGHVLRYVGVGEDYLERLSKAVADYDRDKKTNSALSGTIFRKIWELSGQDDDHLDQKINDIFQSDCIVFWKRNLQENYAQELDLNIVEAILQEGLQRRGI